MFGNSVGKQGLNLFMLYSDSVIRNFSRAPSFAQCPASLALGYKRDGLFAESELLFRGA